MASPSVHDQRLPGLPAPDQLASQPASGLGETLWSPPPDWRETTRIGRYLQWLEDQRGLFFDSYQDLWRWSVDDLEAFWRTIWDYFDVLAQSEADTVLADRRMPGARWFPGSCLNFAENALRGPDDDIVVVARSQTRPNTAMTRAELRGAVGAVAARLRELGVQPGDRVVGYLPNIPEAVVAMLATVSIGAVWACCSPEMGTRSVLDRFGQLEPKVLFAVDGYMYGDKRVERAAELGTIQGGLSSLDATIVVPYLEKNGTSDDIDRAGHLNWTRIVDTPVAPQFESVPFDHPLWVLFSSGTTGLPKGIVHSHGGILLESLKSLALRDDLGPGDCYFVYCTTTWMMWNLLAASLLVGSTLVCFDGNPNYPDPLELWRIAAETGTTVFGSGAAFLLNGRKARLEPGSSFDLSRLRGVASTGSPLPPEGFRWVYQSVSDRVHLQSGSGGTDVCSAFVGGSHMVPVRAGEISCRCLGVDVEAFNPDGMVVVGDPGELVVRSPMPSMPIYLWNDPDGSLYEATYFSMYPGVWRHGDWVTFYENGGCVISGRSDGTLNRGGIRLGTSEFYAVVDDVPEVDDSLVVHLEDASGGPGELLLFVQLAPGLELDDELGTRIGRNLQAMLSPRHRPDRILAVPAIPYNLTGKKLEIPVKRILSGEKRSTVVSDGAVRDASALDVFEALAR